MNDLDLPLKGPALYNPHLLSKDELIGLFSARQALLEELLDDLRSAPPSQSAQHHLIVGQRGMGKTMLLRRLQFAVEDDAELNETWLALSFPEEQYNVAGLSDFWLNCLDAFSDTLERLGREGKVEGLDRAVGELHDLPEGERARRALDELVQAGKSLNRRLLLLVDNADLVLERIDDQEWTLREILSSVPSITFLGASAAAIESTYEYGKAFYDFFRIHDLGGLNLEETRALLLQYADLEERQEVRKVIEEETGRVRTLHTLTGGNPRTLALLFNIFVQGPEGDVRTDLERLLDQCTPLYKARFEALPAQAQQVVDALALRWDPTSAGELAEDLRLQVNKVSAQLNRLTQMGIVEKVPYEPASKTGFQIAERFFNIWYLMRASRRVRRRLVWLVEFLRMFYGQDELREQAQQHLRHAVELGSNGGLRYAEYSFALALASDDSKLRGILERSALQILVSQEKFRHHLGELIDLGSTDRSLRDRAEYLRRIAALRERLARIIATKKLLLDRDAERFLRSPFDVEQKERFVDALEEAEADDAARLAEHIASLGRYVVEGTSALEHGDRLLQAIDKGQMISIDDVEGGEVAEAASGLRGLVAMAAATRVYFTQREGSVDEQALNALDRSLEFPASEYSWRIWLTAVGSLKSRKELSSAISRVARTKENARKILEESARDLAENFGKTRHAEEVIRRAIELEPHAASPWLVLGDVFAAQDRIDEAEEAYRKAVGRAPEDWQTWNGLGYFLLRQKRLKEAEEAFVHSTTISSTNAWAWIGLGICLSLSKRPKEAEKALVRATEADPENTWAWYPLAIEMWAQGSQQEAEQTLRKAIALDAENAGAKHFLAKILFSLDRSPDEAGSLLEEAASSRYGTPQMNYDLASIRVQRGEWKLAVEPAESFLKSWRAQASDRSWSLIVAFFRNAVAAGKAREASDLLDSLDLTERWRPLREALEAIARDNPDYLRRVAPEVRKPAEELLVELTGSTDEAA